LPDKSRFQELAKKGILPEPEIVIRHFTYFGPDIQGLLERIDDEKWRGYLKAGSETAKWEIEEQPDLRFAHWGKQLDTEAQDMITGMTNLDPGARTTIDHILKSPWWGEDN
jgi:hypothetical protein